MSLQVKDDFDLLNLMISDLHAAPEMYKPTNYWLNYEKKFMPLLRSQGLHDFRRNRKMPVLSSFGATDLLPTTKIIRLFNKIGLSNWSRLLRRASGVNYEDTQLLCYNFAKLYGQKCNAKPIEAFDGSLIGNPEDYFTVDNQIYTMSLLYYYVQYAYCCQFINFDSINSIMEIGCGSGKQTEILKKLYPKINFFLFDIPPQLYVCEQYLSALFPENIVSYRMTKTLTKIDSKNEGKIFICGTWQLPKIQDLKYDLFWNSASFQEMEPNVALNYLGFVNQQARYVFLNELMTGKEIASKTGAHGVLNQTKLEHYYSGLKNFKLLNLSDSIFFPRAWPGYKFSFWIR